MPKRRRPRRMVLLREAAAVLDRPAATIALAEAATVPSGGCRKYRACLIKVGWGVGGYYGQEVLAADGPAAWPEGTHMHIDHPSITEEFDRPERSLHTLVGKICSRPAFESGAVGPGLYADVAVFPSWQARIDELREDVGLSIRAHGTAEPGEADGRTGMIITGIVAAPTNTVDYVTRGGAGGRVVQLLESIRAKVTGKQIKLREAGSVGAWFEARIHSEFTEQADSSYGWGELSRSERIALSSAIGDALDAFVARLQAEAPQLYERDRWGDRPTTPPEPTTGGGDQTMTSQVGEPIAMTEATKPAQAPAGTPPPAERKEQPTMGDTTTAAGTDVAALQRQLAESKAAYELALQESQRQAAEATEQLAELRLAQVNASNEASARETVTRLLDADTCPLVAAARPAMRGQIEAAAIAHVRNLTEAANPADLDTAVTSAITAANAQVTALAEALGAGRPAGVGASIVGVQSTGTATSADPTIDLVEAYRSIGMSEQAAKLAAVGRQI
jgi:hypothetical protein